MAKPKLILHIGTEKTGTSSIQAFLNFNRNNLESQGIHYLRCAGDTNNRKIPAAILDETANDDYFKLNMLNTKESIINFKKQFWLDFHEEITNLDSRLHTVIISSEHFHSRVNSYELTLKLKKKFDIYFSEIKIICYLREQSEMCESWYSTALKNGHYESFKQFIIQCNPQNNYYNHKTMLENWKLAFGINALKVRIFDKNNFINKDLIDDFIFLIDENLIINLEKKYTNENESINLHGQTLIRAINHILHNPKVINCDKNNKLQSAKQIIFTKFAGKGVKVTRTDYDRIYGDFLESNIQLSHIYFNSKWPIFADRNKGKLSKYYECDLYSEYLIDIFLAIMELTLSFGADDAEKLRDISLYLGHHNKFEFAYYVMKLARNIKPNGELINKKLNEYQQKIV